MNICENFSHALDFDYIIDVRPPSEYRESNIIGAINLPVMSDSERELVGTLYKTDRLMANIVGASIACENIADLLKNSESDNGLSGVLNHKNRLLIYCARGGKRSESVCLVLSSIGFRVAQLKNGYKGYRNFVLDSLDREPKSGFLTLTGVSGGGKSEIIENSKEWSLDIEALASHYGSSFGGMARNQPTSKMFQNLIFSELERLKNQKTVLVESESKKLGSLVIPTKLYEAYKKSPTILITSSIENRVKRTLKLYENIESVEFLSAMEKITPYISRELKNEILLAWEMDKRDIVAELLLTKYYDKIYKIERYDYVVDGDNLESAISEIEAIRDALN